MVESFGNQKKRKRVFERIIMLPSTVDTISIGGKFESEKMNGWGIEFRFNIALIGNFIEDKLNGDGMSISLYGKYIGQLVDSKFDGIGTYTYNNGVKYEGEWYKGYFHGLGSITYPDGIQYEGQWHMNKPGCMDCFIIF